MKILKKYINLKQRKKIQIFSKVFLKHKNKRILRIFRNLVKKI